MSNGLSSVEQRTPTTPPTILEEYMLLPETRLTGLYPPLPHRSSFRVLTILPPHHDKVMICTLAVQDIGVCEYTAGSYEWGGPRTTTEIIVNHHGVQIRRNLYLALLRLRSEGIKSVWVDALCINQADNVERGHQVALMSDIYALAEQVISWLGPVETLLHTTVASSDNQELKEYVNSCSYWTRVWIIQEFVLAQFVALVYGPDIFIADRDGDQFRPWRIEGSRFDEFCAFRAAKRRNLLYDQPTVPFGFDLSEALRISARSGSTDPRDKVYAILGLVLDADVLEPDYTVSPCQVFRYTLVVLLKRWKMPDWGAVLCGNFGETSATKDARNICQGDCGTLEALNLVASKGIQELCDITWRRGIPHFCFREGALPVRFRRTS